MDTLTLIAVTLASISIITLCFVVGKQFKIVRLEETFAAVYQLAGAIVMDDEDGGRKMREIEFAAACTLLLDVTADPNGIAAQELLKMDPTKDFYDDVYARVRFRTNVPVSQAPLPN